MTGRIRSQGRDRDHRHPRRPRLVRVRLGEDEYDVVAAAARASGLTPTGYAAEAALAAARQAGQQTPSADVEAVRELMTTRAQLRRYGNNLNQAARILNAGRRPTRLAEERHRPDRPSRSPHRPGRPGPARPAQRSSMTASQFCRVEGVRGASSAGLKTCVTPPTVGRVDERI